MSGASPSGTRRFLLLNVKSTLLTAPMMACGVAAGAFHDAK